MDFNQGFTIWRELGASGSAEGDNISFQALTAIHYVHRLAAYVVFTAMIVLAVRLHRSGVLRTEARWLGGLAVFQFATGLGNVLLGWPLLAAVMHTGGAAAMVIVITGVVLRTRSVSEPVGASISNASRLSA